MKEINEKEMIYLKNYINTDHFHSIVNEFKTLSIEDVRLAKINWKNFTDEQIISFFKWGYTKGYRKNGKMDRVR